MKPLAIVSAFSVCLLIFVAGCENEPEATAPHELEAPATPASSEASDRESGTPGETVTHDAEQRREEYERTLRERIRNLDQQIDRLSQHIDEYGKAAKAEWREQLAELRERRAELEPRLERLKEATGAAWEEIRQGTEAAWSELSAAYRRASERFETESKRPSVEQTDVRESETESADTPQAE